MKYNWSPVIKSALSHLLAVGMKLDSVDNGDGCEDATDIASATALVDAVDDARVYLRDPENKLCVVYLVLGNDPEELFCDYSCNHWIDKAQEAFTKEWEGKKCPTIGA